jgi:hypothetical protein
MNSFGSNDVEMQMDSDRSLLESIFGCHALMMGDLVDGPSNATYSNDFLPNCSSAPSFSTICSSHTGIFGASNSSMHSQLLPGTAAHLQPQKGVDLLLPHPSSLVQRHHQLSVKTEEDESITTACGSPASMKASDATSLLFNREQQLQQQQPSSRNSADGASESDVDANYFDQYEPHELEEVPDPAQLQKEPWFITVKSAGVRVKGRSRKELLEVADKIKKRRRESAARSRAKKANKINSLTSENGNLRDENLKLKTQLQKLLSSRGSSTLSTTPNAGAPES